MPDTVSSPSSIHIRRFESRTGQVHLGAYDGADATACGRSAGVSNGYLHAEAPVTCRTCRRLAPRVYRAWGAAVPPGVLERLPVRLPDPDPPFADDCPEHITPTPDDDFWGTGQGLPGL